MLFLHSIIGSIHQKIKSNCLYILVRSPSFMESTVVLKHLKTPATVTLLKKLFWIDLPDVMFPAVDDGDPPFKIKKNISNL